MSLADSDFFESFDFESDLESDSDSDDSSDSGFDLPFALAALAVVVHIEPAAFEDDRHRVDDATRLDAALRTVGNRLVGETLLDFELMPATRTTGNRTWA